MENLKRNPKANRDFRQLRFNLKNEIEDAVRLMGR
jgi:hypothetical protein